MIAISCLPSCTDTDAREFDDTRALQGLYHNNGRTDGLPIVPRSATGRRADLATLLSNERA